MMWCSEAVSMGRLGYALISKTFSGTELWWLVFFPDRVKWISNFDSGSRKEKGVGKLIIFHLQRIQLRGRNFLIHWFQDNRMSRSMPDVTFSLWRWEEELGCYWSLHAATGKGLCYTSCKELEHRKRFGSAISGESVEQKTCSPDTIVNQWRKVRRL